MGSGSRATEIVLFLSNIFPKPLFCGCVKIAQYTRAWETQGMYCFMAH